MALAEAAARSAGHRRPPCPGGPRAGAAGTEGGSRGSPRVRRLAANDIYRLIRNLIKVSHHNVMALHFGLLVRQLVILHFEAGGESAR